MMVSFWFTRRPRESALWPAALYPRRTNCRRKGCRPGTTLTSGGHRGVLAILFRPSCSDPQQVQLALYCSVDSFPELRDCYIGLLQCASGQAVKKNPAKPGKKVYQKTGKMGKFSIQKSFPFFSGFYGFFNTFLRFLPFFSQVFIYKRENLSESERRAKKGDKKES